MPKRSRTESDRPNKKARTIDLEEVPILDDLVKKDPDILAARLAPSEPTLLTRVVLEYDNRHKELGTLLMTAPKEAFAPPTGPLDFDVYEPETATVPIAAAFCQLMWCSRMGRSLSHENQRLLAERTPRLPQAFWKKMVDILVESYLFCGDEDEHIFSDAMLCKIFQEANYSGEHMDSVAERMVDLEYGYFLARCSFEVYDYIRSLSASYRTRDVCDWNTVDDEGDGLECLPLYRHARAR